jgi:stage V sporulation protein D (sporulation-specific penicillin-binding protein)
MSSQFLTRIRLLSVLIIVGAVVLCGKLYLLQIVNGEAYSERADRQYVKPNQRVFNRGGIYFENKDGDLVGAATVKEGFTIVINPRLLGDAKQVHDAISAIVPLDTDAFYLKAGKKDDPYEEILRRVDRDKAEAVEALKLTGVNIYKERWRVYPGGTLAAHTLGFVGYKDDVLAGRYGVERYYEDVLARNSDNLYVNFFAEIFSNLNKTILGSSKAEGDVVAYIDPTAQGFVEKKVEEISKKWDSEKTGAIVIDPVTGAVYSMALYPGFDPNQLKDEKDPAIFSNSLVESVYEMGSIIKPLTVAAGLDSGSITSKTTYYDEGFLVLNGKRISNFDGKGRGYVDMQHVLNESLNTGAAYVVTKIGKERFASYMLNFGIGEETGIDLPNEAHGLVENLKSPRDIEHATASYGQGIAMTPIETVRALSSLANGGLLIQPHVAKRIEYSVGFSKKIVPDEGKRVLKKETSEEITRMLVEVVDTSLLKGAVKMKNYTIAAKTGTAQIANPNGGGYYQDRYLHSFFGYFPAYNPRFLVFIYTVNPKGVRYASETLTYPFIDIVKFFINYYNLPPDR